VGVSECECVQVLVSVCVSERPSVGEKETARVSERPIAVKKSLRRREHRV